MGFGPCSVPNGLCDTRCEPLSLSGLQCPHLLSKNITLEQWLSNEIEMSLNLRTGDAGAVWFKGVGGPESPFLQGGCPGYS